jgi:transitional endoplasmic reticulum ATPase
MKLRVSEARTKDVGRGIARIDPEYMGQLNASVGDVVEITGKRKTYAKVMPSFPEDRGKGTIQIDGIIRSSANIGLNEDVNVQRADIKSANMVVLQPVEPFIQREIDARLLEGMPVCKDDRIRLNIFGGRFDFIVIDVNPDIGIITKKTIIKIHGKEVKEKEGKRGFVSYEDVGGLKNQVQKIREMIELPLKYPELFERVGIEPPKGVLLYGPPGTGKTLIAKAVAHETDAHFSFVTGPEIVGKFYGESEARLRGIFADAEKNAPSIVFLDEIDAIAPKREEMGGEKQVERRIVAQLLSLMDGLKSRGQVIVIAATNMPNLLDLALRRPGRFDREIEIPIPDREGRKEILEIHTRGMPLSEDVDLDEIANITHGYAGADLAALCREVAMHALRKVLPDIDFKKDYISYELLSELRVEKGDFTNAFMEIEPSALREVFV